MTYRRPKISDLKRAIATWKMEAVLLRMEDDSAPTLHAMDRRRHQAMVYEKCAKELLILIGGGE